MLLWVWTELGLSAQYVVDASDGPLSMHCAASEHSLDSDSSRDISGQLSEPESGLKSTQ